MENKFELVTIRKGEVKTVDAFIKGFNAIGKNMKTLSVSAYMLLNDDNVEVRREFKTRCYDELHMSASTVTFLKTAGFLYLLDDRFYKFSYTNVIYFKKALEHYTEVNPSIHFDLNSDENDIHIDNIFRELATMHYSLVAQDDKEEHVEQLLTLSQKELKNLIDKWCTPIEVVDDTTEDASEDESEDTSDDTTEDVSDEEIEEVNSHLITYLDDDIDAINTIIDACMANQKITKTALLDALGMIKKCLDENRR